MGAATFAYGLDPQDVVGNKRVIKGTLTLSASYATGGDSFDLAAETGLSEISKILVDDNDTGVSLELAGTSKVPLIKCYATAATEVAALTDQATFDIPVWLFGTT